MKACASCNTTPGFFHRLKQCPVKKGGCGESFCGKCLDFAVATESESAQAPQVTAFCKSCFKKHSNLKFDENESVTIVSAPNPTTSIVFVHGGSGSRFMFLPHAKELVRRGPYKCILLDLPGHGVKMDDLLTLDSAIDTILAVTKEHAGPNPIYVGGSLGGYIGMELFGKHPEVFKAAIIMMCGQRVGVGAGFMARMGISLFRTVIPLLSSATLLKGLISAAKANGHLDPDIVFETSLRSGAFFNQGLAQVKILAESNPVASLPLYKGKALFINGSKDHRDSEKLWQSLTPSGELKVYEGADHFFSHDNRFYERLLNDMIQFIESAK